MAEIATYKCNNYRCLLTIRVCKDFPVWLENAPMQGRSLVPSVDYLPFVARYRSEIYCHHCKVVLTDASEATCNQCGNSDLNEDQSGRCCTQCLIGVLKMTALTVR